MRAEQKSISDGFGPVRTTLLDLVQWLIQEELTPDDIVETIQEWIDSGCVVLVGNFREWLPEDSNVSEAPRNTDLAR